MKPFFNLNKNDKANEYILYVLRTIKSKLKLINYFLFLII